jgi:hypothetical protein
VTDPPSLPEPAEKRRILNQFLAECKELREMEARLARFSVFRVLGSEDSEIRHSNLLAWLFDPEESHGLGDAFLKSFLVKLKLRSDDREMLPDVIDVETAQFEEATIRREWSDHRTHDRLDLLTVLHLRGGGIWVLAIEVKVNAKQSQGQLARYWDKVEREYGSTTCRRIYLFLTRDGEEPEDDSGFLRTDFACVHAALMDCLAQRSGLIAAGPKQLLDDYCRLLETHFMPDNDIGNMARKILKEHPEALDIIFSYRQDMVRMVSDQLDKDLPAVVDGLGYEKPHVTKGYVTLLPKSWRTEANKLGKGTPFVSLCLDFYGGQAWVRIVLGGGEKDFRDRVIAAATEAAGFRRQSTRTHGVKWTYLHSQKLTVVVPDQESDGSEEVASELLRQLIAALKSPEMQARVTALALVLASSTAVAPAPVAPAPASSELLRSHHAND